MLAQLKTVVLIKKAIKLAFFRLVEYLELSGASAFVGSITGSKWPDTKNFLLKRISLFLFWEMKTIPLWEIAKKLRISYNAAYFPSQNSANCL